MKTGIFGIAATVVFWGGVSSAATLGLETDAPILVSDPGLPASVSFFDVSFDLDGSEFFMDIFADFVPQQEPILSDGGVSVFGDVVFDGSGTFIEQNSELSFEAEALSVARGVLGFGFVDSTMELLILNPFSEFFGSGDDNYLVELDFGSESVSSILSSINEENFFDVSFSVAKVSSETVAAVPLPASSGLLLVGIAGLASIARRRTSNG